MNILIAGLIFLIGFTLMKNIETKGERNNNPGNIRANNTHWDGQTGQDEDGYVIFSSPVYGIRAMAKILLNYQKDHGINTITGIINRWAPHSDNNPTNNYIGFVSGFMDIEPLHIFDISKHLPTLIKAIIHFENGKDAYNDKEIALGITAAKQ